MDNDILDSRSMKMLKRYVENGGDINIDYFYLYDFTLERVTHHKNKNNYPNIYAFFEYKYYEMVNYLIELGALYDCLHDYQENRFDIEERYYIDPIQKNKLFRYGVFFSKYKKFLFCYQFFI